MLVKLIALGFSPPVWKNVFHHIRTALPHTPFSAAIFSTAEEIAFLQGDYFPGAWLREGPDFLFSEAPTGREWHDRLRFMVQVQNVEAGSVSSGEPYEERQNPARRPALVLALSTLEHSLRQLVQGPYPIRLILDNGSRFRVSDPAMVVESFPPRFPRLAVHDHLTRIKLRQKRGNLDEFSPLRLAHGVVLGLDEIEAVEQLGERMEPAEWVKRVAKTEKIRLSRTQALGVLREAKGLYLFPGVPVGRVRGVVIGDVEYAHLLDMGQMTPQSAHFGAVVGAIRQSAEGQARRLEAVTRRLREAEAKRDLPVVCGGSVGVMNDLFAERLAAEGFARLATVEEMRDDLFREPTLLIRVTPFASDGLGNQVEPPALLPIEGEFAGPLNSLHGLPPLTEIPYASGEEAAPLAEAELAEQKGVLLARAARARSGRNLAEKRLLLIRQEYAVLETADRQLAELLEAKDSLRVWNGSLSDPVRQVLVFSHDQEEAGAVLQALPRVAKKRWFDLSRFTTAESTLGLTQAPIEEYRREGLVVVTASSRERLTELLSRIAQDLAEARRQVEEAEAALGFYQAEYDKALAAQGALARRWIRGVIREWMERERGRLMEELDLIRHRHERQWLSRAMIHRVLIISSSGENRPALLEACRRIYPAFDGEHSVVIPYDFEPLDHLPREQAEQIVRQGKEKGLEGVKVSDRLETALADQNRALFAAYLDVLAANLETMPADLMLIEHRPLVAGEVLEFLRTRIPEMKDTPAVLIVPEYWAPPPDQPLPWPYARVVVLRRLGGLTAQECEQALLSIHPA